MCVLVGWGYCKITLAVNYSNKLFLCVHLFFSRRFKAVRPQRRAFRPIPVHPSLPTVTAGWSHVSQCIVCVCMCVCVPYNQTSKLLSTLLLWQKTGCRRWVGFSVGQQADDDQCEHTEQSSPPDESRTKSLSELLSGVHHQTPTLTLTEVF